MLLCRLAKLRQTSPNFAWRRGPDSSTPRNLSDTCIVPGNPMMLPFATLCESNRHWLSVVNTSQLNLQIARRGSLRKALPGRQLTLSSSWSLQFGPTRIPKCRFTTFVFTYASCEGRWILPNSRKGLCARELTNIHFLHVRSRQSKVDVWLLCPCCNSRSMAKSLYANTHALAHTHIYIYTHTYIHTHTHVCMSIKSLYMPPYMYIYRYIDIAISLCIYISLI